MKFSILLHKKSLENQRVYYRSLVKDLERRQIEADKLLSEIEVLSTQISLAEKEGKDGFDSDKFNKKRAAK